MWLFLYFFLSIATNTLALNNQGTAASSPFGITGVRYPIMEIDQAQMAKTTQMVQLTGAAWMRGTPVVWGKVETKRGFYDWRAYDAIIKECQDKGLFMILNVAPWADWEQGGAKQSRKI